MSSRDDSPTDMDSHDLSDEQAEALLAGTQAPHGFEGVAAEFSALRQLSSQPHDVAVSAPLGEFVTQPSAPPADVPLVPVLVPAAMSPSPPRRKPMLAGLVGTTAAKLALAGGVAVAGVTGAHAVGLVDVPLLPSQSDPIEFVSAAQAPDGDEAPESPAPLEKGDGGGDEPDGTEPEQAPDVDGTIKIEVGGTEFNITIDGSGDGDVSIKVDVEGVSPSCETALEALGDLTDLDAFESAGQDIEEACSEDFADFDPNLGDLSFEADGVFGGVFGDDCNIGDNTTGQSLDELLAACLPGGLEIFGDLGGFEDFQEQFGKDFGDLSDLEGLLEDLDLGNLDLDGLLEGQDFSQIEDLLEDLDLGDLDSMIEELLAQLEGG